MTAVTAPVQSLRRRIRGAALPVRRRVRHSRLFQLALLVLLWGAVTAVVRLLALPIPPGIAGMVLLLVALATGVVRPATFRRGADWLFAEMMLFFVPALVTVIEYPQFVGWLGVELLGIIVASTLLVMVVTALTVEWAARRIGSHAHG